MAQTQGLRKISGEGLALIAERFRALGDCSRLRLMVELAAGELSVSELIQSTGLTQANASRHLQTLAAAGLLRRRKEGACVFYQVAEPSIYEFCSVMCQGLSRHLENLAKKLPRQKD
jgi:DNA-binding transcriptional ArsR family regulator